MEEFEFEDLGVEILSLVDKPAIEVNWMAFNEEQFVKPTSGESESDFISRCIPIVIAEGKDADQAAAICYTYYRGQQQFESYNDYPESAKTAAKRALEWRDSHPDQDCGTQVGWTRANQLAKGENISEETIARMASFARHLQYKDVPYSEGCGGLMVDAWGGQAGIEWASNKLKSIRGEEFSKQEDDKFQEHVLKIAQEVGEPMNPEDIIYLDGSKEEFATVSDYLQGARALDALEGLDPSTPAQLRYRYAGPAGQRTFCATLKALNRTYSREDITRMNRFNPGFGPRGSNTYDVFKYKGANNCRHYWEEMVQFNNGTKNVLISLGPAQGEAGQSNNSNDQSPDGAVANNAYLMSKAWSFSNDDEMIVTGPAMIPNALIPRRDEMGNLFHVYFSKETVKNIAKKFLEDNNTHNTDINHDDNVVTENTLLESWIVANPEMDKSTALGFNVPEGTWMTSYKINNEETWQKIKAGELNGFSVTGNFLEIVQS
jgi:hypothetical protein